MKRWFIIAVCASALLLAGGSGAATSLRPNVVLKYGELARIGNTLEVCAAVRVGIKIGPAPKQMAPAIACYPTKTGRPVVGSHVNLAMWANGAMLAGLGRWIRENGVLGVNLTDMWTPSEWQYDIYTDFYIFTSSKDQLLGKVKVRLNARDTSFRFAPGSSRQGFVCDVIGGYGENSYPLNTVSCFSRQTGTVTLEITFWPPYGAKNLEVYSRDDTCGCGTTRIQILYKP